MISQLFSRENQKPMLKIKNKTKSSNHPGVSGNYVDFKGLLIITKIGIGDDHGCE